MRHSAKSLIAAIVLTVLGPVAANSALAADKDEQAVKQAAAQFYNALNAMFTGNLAPMKEVWSHADDVTYMGPDGTFEVGWDKVLVNWESQAARKFGGKVEPAEMQITVGTNLAVTHNFEQGKNINTDGKPQKVNIRATNLFRKESGQWKMIGHHTDVLPFLKKSQKK